MLSSQTKDQQTDKAMRNLKSVGLSMSTISKLDEESIEKLIYGVAFHKRKAEYIKRTTEMIQKSFEGEVPSVLNQILELPGVGMKMALLLQQGAFGIVEGISVDTHVHRISNLLGWTASNNAEQTRKQLQKWVPKDKWKQVNHMLVGFGQTICKPIAPNCKGCKINDSCPKAFWYEKRKKESKIKYEKESEWVKE